MFVIMVSICIPTYNKQGSQHDECYNNTTMLVKLFVSISEQTYKNFEVIISDHSLDNSIKEVCDKFEQELHIKYFKFEKKYGSCEANMNNAISKATGEYIKPMFQDDYFFDSQALEKMVAALENSTHHWVVVGCAHINENNYDEVFNYHPPVFKDEMSMLGGENLIGSPIVIMYRNNKEFYDEFLIWLMDVEFYYRLITKYGLPVFLNDILLISRLRSDGITNTQISKELVKDEIKYCFDKHYNGLKNINEYSKIYDRITKNKIYEEHK